MPRDPRTDPHAEDVLRKKNKVRTVSHTYHFGEVFYYPGASKVLRSCWITTWRDWCRNAEVLHVAAD